MFGDNRMRAIHLRQGLTFVNGFPYAGDAREPARFLWADGILAGVDGKTYSQASADIVGHFLKRR